MELSSRCTAEGPTVGGDSEIVGGDFIGKHAIVVGDISKSMRVTARAQQRLFGVFFAFFQSLCKFKGSFLVVSGDMLSRLVKP